MWPPGVLPVSTLADIRPADRLGDSPKVADQAAAELALSEARWCESQHAAIHAHFEQQIAALTREYQAAIKLDGGQTLQERSDQLTGAVCDWADGQRSQLCKGAGKSYKLAGGVIRWRKSPDSIEMETGWTAGEVVQCVERRVAGAIRELISRLNFFGLVKVSLSLDRRAGLAAVKRGDLTDERLSKIGLRFVKGDEFVSVELEGRD